MLWVLWFWWSCSKCFHADYMVPVLLLSCLWDGAFIYYLFLLLFIYLFIYLFISDLWWLTEQRQLSMIILETRYFGRFDIYCFLSLKNILIHFHLSFLYVYICICKHICLCLCVCMCICVCVYICICKHICLHLCVCMSICVCVLYLYM